MGVGWGWQNYQRLVHTAKYRVIVMVKNTAYALLIRTGAQRATHAQATHQRMRASPAPRYTKP
jgi:hypothetical protein